MSCIPTVSTAESAHRSASSTCPFARTISASVRCASITFARSSSESSWRTASRRICSARSGSPPCQTATPSSCCVRPASAAAPISSKSARAVPNASAASSKRPRRRRIEPWMRDAQAEAERLPLESASATAADEDLLRLRELEPLEVRCGELAERQALEIRAPRLARDLERVARVPLDAAEVTFPPADGREQRERLRPRVARRVGEQLERLAAELSPLLDVGVPVEPDLGDLDERETLDRPVARRACLLAHGLHLDGGRGELPQPPRGPSGAVAAGEARLELDRAQQQPARPPVRLALERPAPRALEGGRGLGAEVVGDAAVELRQQRRGTLEVERLRLDEVVRTRAQPFGERAVERCADALREPAVGDVADQDVPEAVRDLAGDRRDRLARQDLAVDEIGERGVDVQLRVELGDRAAPEHAADQGAVAEHRPRRRRQGVDPGRDERLQACPGSARRHPLPARRASGRSPRRRAGCPRSCRGGRSRNPSGRAAPSTSASTSAAVSESASGASSIVIDRRRAAPPARARVEELGAREADDEHRSVVDPVGEVLDQVEQRLLRPVDVLEARARAAAPRRGSSPTRAPPRRSRGRGGCPRRCRARRTRARAGRRPRRSCTRPGASRSPPPASRRRRSRPPTAPSPRAAGRRFPLRTARTVP